MGMRAEEGTRIDRRSKRLIEDLISRNTLLPVLEQIAMDCHGRAKTKAVEAGADIIRGKRDLPR
jgi:hypothetical protein